jgi:hypothetical protein
MSNKLPNITLRIIEQFNVFEWVAYRITQILNSLEVVLIRKPDLSIKTKEETYHHPCMNQVYEQEAHKMRKHLSLRVPITFSSYWRQISLAEARFSGLDCFYFINWESSSHNTGYGVTTLENLFIPWCHISDGSLAFVHLVFVQIRLQTCIKNTTIKNLMNSIIQVISH